MKFTSIILAILIFSTINSIAQNNREFPPYNEIVTTLCQKTSLCKIDFESSTVKVGVEKRIDGYWVGTSLYKNAKEGCINKDMMLFWSPEKGYKEINFEGPSEHMELKQYHFRNQPSYTSKYDQHNEFNIQPCFGYPNWFDDVIQLYHKKEKNTSLNTEELYALARAYSKKYESFLDIYANKIQNGALPNEQAIIDTVKYCAQKAIDYFEKTYSIEPSFEVLVGNIYTKYCNEYMSLYTHLATYNKKAEALACLNNKKLYTPTSIAFAKNILSSCPMNSILFTYGDNDTYIPLYVQLVENFRTDVLIINISLFMRDYYINHLKNQAFYPNKYLQVDLDKALYEGSKNNYVLLDKTKGSAAIDMIEMKQLLQKETSIKSNGDETPRTFPNNKFIISSAKRSKTFEVSSSYLIKHHILIFALIQSNIDKRPICFAPSFGFSYNSTTTKEIDLFSSLHLNGYCHLLKFTESQGKSIANVIALDNYQLLKQFKWPQKINVGSHDKSFYYNLLMSVFATVEKLIKVEEKAKALDLLKKYHHLFKSSLGYQDAIPNSFIHYYFTLGKKRKGTRIVKQLIDSFKEKNKLSKKTISLLKQLEGITMTHNINAFKADFNALFNKPIKNNPL